MYLSEIISLTRETIRPFAALYR